jgi:AmiR/NasT family two-component response regulator
LFSLQSFFPLKAKEYLMKPLSVIVAQSNSKTAELLAKSLCNHFRAVNVAGNLDELRNAILRHRADVAILDLELANLDDVQQLAREFAGTTIVCTHRLADEKMWSDALAAGAADCCFASDVRAIVLAALPTRPLSHSHAA